MVNKVKKTIINYDMLRKRDHIIIGFSGGGDSCALLYVLNEIKEAYDLKITAVHINHGYRSAEALRDEKVCERICQELKIPIEIYRFHMESYAKERGITLEEGGRLFRYDTFYKVLKEKNAHKIAVAHHMDDNAETMLMRFMRGTGLKGLRGISPVRDQIIRPLIDCTRAEIEAYLNENNVEFINDSSNYDDVFMRNNIRLNLLPLIKKTINPGIIRSLKRNAEIFSLEDDYISREAQKAFEGIVTAENSTLKIHKLLFSEIHSALRLRIGRLCIEQMQGSLKDFDHTHAELIANAADYETGKEFSLREGIIVQNSYEHIILYKKEEKRMLNEILQDGCFIYLEDRNIYLSVSYFEPFDKENFINICTKVFDYDKIKDSLSLRTRISGDRIFIANIGGNKKLKDYFIDCKVPRGERDKVPLLVSNGKVLWILDEKSICDTRYMAENVENGIFIELWRKKRDENQRNDFTEGT